MGPIFCPYCGARAKLADSSVIYHGQDFGKIWLCFNWPKCSAYVSCHSGSNKPLGTLADAGLRELRKRVHEYFDQLWKAKMNKGPYSKRYARSSAYIWLSKEMKIEPGDTHIAMFDETQCLKAIDICSPYFKKVK